MSTQEKESRNISFLSATIQFLWLRLKKVSQKGKSFKSVLVKIKIADQA